MQTEIDILSMAFNTAVLSDTLVVLQEKDRQIPGSVQYTIKRLKKERPLIDDTGILNYHVSKKHPVENYLELRFCISGNTYCNQKEGKCNFCKANVQKKCTEKIDCIDIVSLKFTPAHLSQFVKAVKHSTFSEDILNFKHTSSFYKILPLCGRTRLVLESLLNHSYSDSLENIFINAQTQMLLLYSMECMAGDKEETFNCKFLANENDREKILKAREILLQHISEPLTIKELSRKVAINECYLKKGFKEMFGTTIFDFFQSQRMEHAKYLLYEKGLSVTDVSNLLGYSYISHFSTAFKKHTGLKPCELLFH
ncbi:MAG: AraC family transcriptional regulator [Ginsengibacter sp.]